MRRFVPVLVALLSGASSGLAGAAADVLAEIVLKRMDPAAKLRCPGTSLCCRLHLHGKWKLKHAGLGTHRFSFSECLG